MLTNWWTSIEGQPRFGGARRHVYRELGAGTGRVLEKLGFLRQEGIAYRVPCERCRVGLREVIELGDEFHLVCESGPGECPDIVLPREDVASLIVDMTAVSQAIAGALGLQGRPEPLTDLVVAHRLGTVLTTPGLRYPVFLVSRTPTMAARDAVGMLIKREKGVPFAALLPTGRHLTDDMERLAREHGITLLALTDILAVQDGKLVARHDPSSLFAGLGRSQPSRLETKAAIVMRAFISDGTSPPAWRDLDERHYTEVQAKAGSYHVFADQKERRIFKSGSLTHARVPDSHFQTIRAALTAHGAYDPNIEGPDQASSKQIFQRARAEFDIKTGRKSGWRLFKSVQRDEGHTVYVFRPDAGVAFAFLVRPGD